MRGLVMLLLCATLGAAEEPDGFAPLTGDATTYTWGTWHTNAPTVIPEGRYDSGVAVETDDGPSPYADGAAPWPHRLDLIRDGERVASFEDGRVEAFVPMEEMRAFVAEIPESELGWVSKWCGEMMLALLEAQKPCECPDPTPCLPQFVDPEAMIPTPGLTIPPDGTLILGDSATITRTFDGCNWHTCDQYGNCSSTLLSCQPVKWSDDPR